MGQWAMFNHLFQISLANLSPIILKALFPGVKLQNQEILVDGRQEFPVYSLSFPTIY